MNQNNYLKKYFKKQRDLLNFDEKTINKIILAGKVIKNTNQKRKKILFLEMVVVLQSQVTSVWILLRMQK